MVVLSRSRAFLRYLSRYSQKKQGRSSSNSDSGYKIQKNKCGGKIYSHTRTTRIEYSSRKKHEILMRLKLQRLLFNLFVYQVQSYCFLVDVFTLGSSAPSSFPRREHSTLTFPQQAQGNFLKDCL